MVMASTVYDFSSKKEYKKPSKFRYFRMIVMDNMKSETVENIVQENIDYNSVVKTDNYTSYNKIKENVWVHHSEKVNPKDVEKILPWVHTMISNAKRTLLCIHHMISKKYMQDYLDEFCYKVNRRYFGENVFDRLLVACLTNNYKNCIHDSRVKLCYHTNVPVLLEIKYQQITSRW